MTGEPQVVLDSSVLLDLFIGADDQRRDSAVRIVKASERGEIELMLPAIVLAELAGAANLRGDHLQRHVRDERVARVRRWLTSTRFTLIEIDERVAMRASQLCAPYQLKGMDACVLAAALCWAIPHVYTNDHDLLKVERQIEGVHVQPPSSFPLPDQIEIEI